MKRTQRIDARANIRKQKVSFLSIIVIAAMAVTAYLGLSFGSHAISNNANRFYDETHFRDAEIISTLLLSPEDLDTLRATEGVADVEPVWQSSGMLHCGDFHKSAVVSSLTDRINVPLLVSGRLPETAQECLLEQELALSLSLNVGDEVHITGAQYLRMERFTVCGIALVPGYPVREMTSPGDREMIVLPAAFDTDSLEGCSMKALLRISDCDGINRFDAAYFTAAEDTMQRIASLSEPLSERRTESILNEYRQQISDGQQELDDAQALLSDARDQLDDGWSELEHGEAEADDALKALSDAKQQLNDALARLSDGQQQLADGQAQLNAAKVQLDGIGTQIASGQAQLADAAAELADGRKQLDDGWAEYHANETLLADAKRQLDDAEARLADAEAELNDARKQLDDGWAEYYENEALLSEGKRQLDDAELRLADAEAELAEGRKQLDDGWAEYRENEAVLADAKQQLVSGEMEYADAGALLAASKAELDAGAAELEAGRAQLIDGAAEIEAGKAQVRESLKSALDYAIGSDTSAYINWAPSGTSLNINDAGASATRLPITEEISLDLNRSLAGNIGAVLSLLTNGALTESELQQALEATFGVITLLPEESFLGGAARMIAEKYAEYDSQYEALASGARAWDAGHAQYIAGLQALSDGAAQYSAGLAEYRDARAQLDAYWKQYEEGAAQLADGLETLEQGEKAYEAGAAELAEGRTAYAEKLAQYHDGAAQLADGLETLEQGEQEFASGQEALAEGTSLYQENLARYQDGAAQLAEGLSVLEQAEADYAAALAEYETAKAQLDAGSAEYADGLASYNAAQAEFDAKAAEYAEGMAAYEDGLDRYESGSREYADALEALENGRAELERRETEYSQGMADYLSGVLRLAEARETMDGMDPCRWVILDPNGNAAYSLLAGCVRSVSDLSMTFALIFIVVGALVIYATLGRIVEEQRRLVGAAKALGLYKREILSKYLVFGVGATLIGMLLGIVLGYFFIQSIITSSYGAFYTFDNSRKAFQIGKTLLVLGGGLILSVSAVCLACADLLRSSATSLLQEKPPASKGSGDHRIGGLSLYGHLILRNILTDKKRVAVTMVSVAGCCTLLLTGFSMKGGVKQALDRYFSDIRIYDCCASFSETADADALSAARGALSDAGADSAAVRTGSQLYSVDGQLSAGVLFCGDTNELQRFFSARDIRDGASVSPESDGVWLSRKISEKKSLHPGDTIVLFDSSMRPYSARYAGAYENYMGVEMVISRESYERIFGVPSADNALLVNFGRAQPTAVESLLSSLSGVESVTYTAEERSNISSFIGILDMIALLLVAIAAIMAYFILLNLANMHINQKKRELTIMRVNGFTTRETIAYIAREAVVTNLAGIVLGVGVGLVVSRRVLRLLEGSEMQFIRQPQPKAIFLAALITAGFSLVINVIALRKVKHLKLTDVA